MSRPVVTTPRWTTRVWLAKLIALLVLLAAFILAVVNQLDLKVAALVGALALAVMIE